MPAGNQNSLIKKASAQNRAKALKIMRFLGLVASQGGAISSARKHIFEKSVAKAVVQKLPSPERRINTGFFGTPKPKGTTPTRLWARYSSLFEVQNNGISLFLL